MKGGRLILKLGNRIAESNPRIPNPHRKLTRETLLVNTLVLLGMQAAIPLMAIKLLLLVEVG